MSRIVGKEGALYVAQYTADPFPAAGAFLGDIMNWELELNIETVECGIQGEAHEQFAVGKVTSRVTAERYVQDSLASSPYATVAAQILLDTAPYTGTNQYSHTAQAARPTGPGPFSGITVVYQLWSLDDQGPGRGVGTNPPVRGPIITGQGFLQRVTVRNPRGMVTEQLEITGNKMPKVVN